MENTFEERFGSHRTSGRFTRDWVVSPHIRSLRTEAVPTPTFSAAPVMGGWTVALILLSLWVLINLRYGYHLEDSVLYLPVAIERINPSLYPDNPLIDHLNRMPYPLYKAMRWIVTGSFGVNGHVILTLMMRSGFVAALYLLMTELTGRRWTGLIASLLVILQPAFYGTLAWTELISPEFVQSDLGKMALMLACVAYLRGHVVLTAAVLGLAFNIHPILSVATAAMLTPDVLRKARDYGVERLARSVLLAGILAMPTIVQILRLGPMDPTSPPVDHVELIRFFNYFHIFPSMFHRWEYVGFLGLLGAGAVAYAAIRPKLEERASTVMCLACGIALWCSVGVVLVEIKPIAAVMQMMPFRITYAARLLATACVVMAGMQLLSERRFWTGLLAVMWIAAMATATRFVPWVTLAVSAWLLTRRRDAWSIVAAIVAAACTAAIVWIDPDQLPRLSRLPWTVIGISLVTLVVRDIEQHGFLWRPGDLSAGEWPTSQRGRIAFLAALVLAGVFDISQISSGVFQPRLVAGTWRSPEGYDTKHDDWQAVMRWARDNTAAADSFITPPDLLGWTWYSRRNTLASYQLGMQSVWDARYGPIMKARLTEIGCTQRWAAGPNYHVFSSEQLLDVAQRHHVGYVVWKKDAPDRMPWTVAYENASFLVYDLRSLTIDSSPSGQTTPGGES